MLLSPIVPHPGRPGRAVSMPCIASLRGLRSSSLRLAELHGARPCFRESYLVLLTHPDRNTQNERRATQSNTRQRTQGKQNQRSRNNTSKPKTEHRGSRTLLETTNDRKPKPYAPTASRSHRNHHPRPTSTTPSKPTKPAKDHPGSYPSPPSAPDAYKQRPSTSRHHSVWSVCPVLSRISQYVRQPDERVGTPRP